jgi:hypothetical protein
MGEAFRATRAAQRPGPTLASWLRIVIHMLRHACGFALANKGHEHPAYGALHRVVTRSLQGLLAMMYGLQLNPDPDQINR